MWVPPAYWQNRLIAWCPQPHIIVPSSSSTSQNTAKYLWLTLTAVCNHIHCLKYTSIPGSKIQKGFPNPPPISKRLLLLQCGEIASVWEVFSNKQLRKGSRLGVELESVCCFKNVCAFCSCFIYWKQWRIFDVLHSVVQPLTGFCGAAWPWGNAYG